jgi:amino-acid N-acetyltransferase
MVIERAKKSDLPDVLRLLERHQLPPDDVHNHIGTMVVARNAERVVGVAALELYADGALLRSVAVDGALQGQGVGHQLTESALAMAREHGVENVFLLTTTAEGFFPKFGFEPIQRNAIPASVRSSVAFQSACPASAVVMRKVLAGGL